MDWQGQAELLKQQTLTTLSHRDQQIRQLTAMLEEAQASKLQHEHTQRQVKSFSLLFKCGTLDAVSLPTFSHVTREVYWFYNCFHRTVI